jgi:hypothetical protein
MTTKPDLVAALLCILVTAAIGVAAGLALSRGSRPPSPVAPAPADH